MHKILPLYATLVLALLLRFLSFHPQTSHFPGQEISLTTTLFTQPQISGKNQRFQTKEGIEIIAPHYPEYQYGDKLKISGVLTVENKNSGDEGFNLLRMKQHEVKAIFPRIEILGKEEGNWVIRNTISLRKKLMAYYQEFLPEPASSLLIGIVLGVKGDMDRELKDNLRKVGLTHVVVASGMNVMLIAGFLSGFLNLFLRRQLTLPLILAGIFFYAILAGFEPPVIRAAIMGSLAIFAQGFGRQNWGLLSLILAGITMLLLNPLLIFDLGFQLSFLATWGLISIRPLFEKIRIIKKVGEVPLLGESLTTTFAAQLATLPLILANFGFYPLISLLTNTLVLWTIPWIMGIGALAGVIGLILKPLGQISAWVVYSLLFYFEKVALLMAKVDFLSLQVEQFSLFFSIAYFSFLTSFLIYLAKKET
ncbi:MAG: ComEC/Rec2 family competence protein [bacterium]|nr:ComEC/Rec2 family competence protein [bacterium]